MMIRRVFLFFFFLFLPLECFASSDQDLLNRSFDQVPFFMKKTLVCSQGEKKDTYSSVFRFRFYNFQNSDFLNDFFKSKSFVGLLKPLDLESSVQSEDLSLDGIYYLNSSLIGSDFENFQSFYALLEKHRSFLMNSFLYKTALYNSEIQKNKFFNSSGVFDFQVRSFVQMSLGQEVVFSLKNFESHDLKWSGNFHFCLPPSTSLLIFGHLRNVSGSSYVMLLSNDVLF